MLMTEWNLNGALAVSREEGWEDGIEEGLETTAKNTLAEGASIEFVSRITGLDPSARASGQ